MCRDSVSPVLTFYVGNADSRFNNKCPPALAVKVVRKLPTHSDLSALISGGKPA